MARIAGIDLPRNKRLDISLTWGCRLIFTILSRAESQQTTFVQFSQKTNRGIFERSNFNGPSDFVSQGTTLQNVKQYHVSI